MKKQKFTVRDLSAIGVMAALVLIATMYFKIDIPTPLGKTMLHLGNVMCVLGGLLFGGVSGGFAAGIGSAIYDIMDPTFAPEFWITFILKFVMGFIAGTIASSGKRTKAKIIIAAAVGSLSYVVLYIAKTIITQYYIMGNPWQTVVAVVITKGTTSLLNAAIATVASVILYTLIAPALKKAGILQRKN